MKSKDEDLVVGIDPKKYNRVCQGDVYSNVEFIEQVKESEGIIEINKIQFPIVLVITQDCDMAQDLKYRLDETDTKDDDKLILSAIVVPLYNAEHVFSGTHYSELNRKMRDAWKSQARNDLKNNQTPRYHYLVFPKDYRIPPSIIDFKHYFCVDVEYLMQLRKGGNFICKIAELYREHISQRFAYYLSRIGLPGMDEIKEDSNIRGTPIGH